ncbi:hypothetical protein ACP70R_014790 [Stipagrostis hirtigluma subsp. patula]
MMQLLLRAHFSFCQSSPGLSLHPPTMISVSVSLSLSQLLQRCTGGLAWCGGGVVLILYSAGWLHPYVSPPEDDGPGWSGGAQMDSYFGARLCRAASPKVEGKGRFASPRGKETPRA